MQAATTPASLDRPRRARALPGPRYRNPLFFLTQARPDPVSYMLRQVRQHGDALSIQVWGLPPMVVLSRPDHVRHVLQENNRNYTKGDLVAKMKLLLGEGLFTSEGDFWRRQRRLAQPAFHRQRIQGFADIMVEATTAALASWDERARAGTPIDVMAEMSSVTLAIVGRALFGVDLSDQATEVGRAVLVALEELTGRVLNPFALPMAVPTPGHRRLRRAMAELDRVVFDIIERRYGSSGVHHDLLAMLMEARDADSGEGMSRQQLRDEVMTFVLAGHETTAVTLAWAAYLLGRHPEAERRARAEVEAALGDRQPVLADLAAMPFTRRVIEETMRLYPPVAAVQRQATGADEIDGCEVTPGSLVLLFAYATHRDPLLWPEPERFDPDRFLPERSEGRHRYAYYPFGAGPRLCIGNEFALMEAQLVLAMMLQRYRLEPVDQRPVEHEVRITLRPKGGVWMRARPASAATSPSC